LQDKGGTTTTGCHREREEREERRLPQLRRVWLQRRVDQRYACGPGRIVERRAKRLVAPAFS
jgi:hypothetical protein